MKKMSYFFWVLSLLAMVVFTACSGDNQLTDPDGTSGTEETSLNLEFGGYETNDEQVAFGDTELLIETENEVEVSDTYATDAIVTDALRSDSTDHRVFVLRATWGYLHGDSTETEVTDWSGSAEVSKGTLVVLKTVRFESNDFVHLPRTSRRLVEFTSQTKPHFDGLVLAIIDHGASDLEGTFTLNAGAFTKTLNFSELDSLELIEPVGGEGQEVSIVSHSRDVRPFNGGFLSGKWIKTRPDGGIFRGRWISSLGTSAGYVRGIWGINDFRNKVFKGKYISVNGDFRGLLAGQWSYTRGSENAGVFSGRWVNRDRQLVGTLRGHFKTGRVGDRRGYFQGRYHIHDQGRAEADPNADALE